MSATQSGLARIVAWLTMIVPIVVTVGCSKPSAPAISSASPPTPASATNEPQAGEQLAAELQANGRVQSADPASHDLNEPREAMESSTAELALSTEERIDVVPQAEAIAVADSAGRAEPGQPPEIDDSYRLWLPTTAGGLLVRLQMQTGERSWQAAFDGRIDEVLADAGVDNGGSWNDLLQFVEAAPETFGSLNSSGQLQKLVTVYDRNRNRRPERDETVNLLFRDSGFAGPFRMLGTDAFRQLNRSQSPLFRALDLDRDQRLSRDEIEQASDSLRSIDRNGDQRIDLLEVTQANRDEQPSDAWNRRNSTRWGHVAMDLVGYIDWSMFADSLAELSHQAIFHAGTSSLANLDRDGDQVVTADESRTLLSMEPDLSLIIHWTQLPITDSPATPPTIQVEFGQHGRKDDVRVTERGDRLRVASDRFQLLITARDQYANPSSAPNSFAPSTTAAPGQDPPIWAVQVRARGAEIPDAMLAWLDDDFDGSLSTRELLACGPRLLRVANADGEVRPVDLPDTFLFQLVRGEPRQDALLFDVVPQLPVRTERPRWAESMDMNQDGDIAVNEFLGDIELFQRIDQNRDGFLDPAETQAAN